MRSLGLSQYGNSCVGNVSKHGKQNFTVVSATSINLVVVDIIIITTMDCRQSGM